MTTQQAADELGTKDRRVVNRLIREGKIKATTKHDQWGQPYRWITKAALEKYRRAKAAGKYPVGRPPGRKKKS